MGFRDELTSATDLDTTSGAGGAGVIITGARATWQDGTGGTGTIEATSSGGGSITGSAYTITGPLGGATDPKVRMSLVDAPAGGYLSRVALSGDQLDLSGVAAVNVTAGALALSAPFAAGPAGAPFADRIGDRVELRGSLTSSTASYAAGTAIDLGIVLPVGLAPAVSRYFTVAVVAAGGSYSTCFVNVRPDRGITLVPQAALAAGFQISLAGIRWRLGVT